MDINIRNEEIISNYDLVFSITKSLKNDFELYNNIAHEISINHRIAIYLEEYLKQNSHFDITVDLEENRFNKSNIFVKYQYGNEIFTQSKRIRPDIMIHQVSNNLYIGKWIEIKIGNNLDKCNFDIMKCYYVSKQLVDTFAISVLIDKDNKRIIMNSFIPLCEYSFINTVYLDDKFNIIRCVSECTNYICEPIQIKDKIIVNVI